MSEEEFKVTKGKEEMTQEEAKKYNPFWVIGTKPYERGGWRVLTAKKSDNITDPKERERFNNKWKDFLGSDSCSKDLSGEKGRP